MEISSWLEGNKVERGPGKVVTYSNKAKGRHRESEAASLPSRVGEYSF